jgi:AraC-like DNA-binding protein
MADRYFMEYRPPCIYVGKRCHLLLFNLSCGSIFLLAFLLLSNVRGANKGANRWMGVFYLFAGFAMLGFIAERSGISLQWLIPATESTRFAMAPALYFSIRCYTNDHYHFRRNDLLHFLPALLFLPILFGANRYLPSWMGMVIGLGVKVQLVLYWIAGYRLLHRRRLPPENAIPPLPDLNWLRNLMLFTGVMVLNYLLSPFMRQHAGAGISYIVYLAAIYLSCYHALKQRHVFPPAEESLAVQPIAEQPRLSEDESAILRVRLAHLMQEEKLYTEPELSLSQLAGRMGLSLHELSWLLNKEIGKNFYQYVNHFRIEQAKTLLQSPDHQHLSILAIGFTAGFNSKTAFNNAFKKMVGVTPVVFRNVVVRMDAGGH